MKTSLLVVTNDHHFFVLLIVSVKEREEYAILLTTYVGRDPSRVPMYMEKIRLYLDRTRAPICVVESSGSSFPIAHDRLRQYSFVGGAHSSSTHAEAESILRAFDSGMLDDYRRIIKITGKYFVPDIETSIPREAEVVYQNRDDSSWKQPSEIFGFDAEHTRAIFEPILHGHRVMEDALQNVHERIGARSFAHFGPLRLEGTLVPRANGDVLRQL